MKKIRKILLSIALTFVLGFGTFFSVNAADWQYADTNVELNYWDVLSWNVAYTGVTNKTTANTYYACVARVDQMWNCNEDPAHYNVYREFGLNEIQRGHGHSVRSAWGTYDYVR